MTAATSYPEALTAFLRGRGLVEASTRGGEVLIRCFRPERHTNGDATPSLRVDLEEGIWRCDVCADGGGAVELVAGLERCSRKDAHRRLLGEDDGGRQPRSPRQPDPPAPASAEVQKLKQAMRRYRARLDTHEGARNAEWLAVRWGVGRETLDHYLVGIGPPVRKPVRTWSLACPSTGPDLTLSGVKLYRPVWKELGGPPKGKAISEKGSKPGLFGGHLLRDGAAKGRTVLVVGGEKDTLIAAAALAGDGESAPIVVANARGESGWRCTRSSTVASELAEAIVRAGPARIVVALDANEEDRGVRHALGAFVRAGATSVCDVVAVTWPPAFVAAHPKGGVAQLVVDFEGGAAALRELVGSATAPGGTTGLELSAAAAASRTFDATAELRHLVPAVWQAILEDEGKAKARAWFVRGGALSEVRVSKSGPEIRILKEAHAHGRVFRLGSWITPGKESDRPAKPTTAIARDLIAYPHAELPVLEAVVACPSFVEGWRLATQAGYAMETRTFLHLDPSLEGFEPPPKKPTHQAIQDAVEILIDPFQDFPFEDEPDRANLLALVLTLLCRDAIDGPVPLFEIEAPTPGSGKTLALEIASRIATGRELIVRSLPRNGEEARKRLTSILRAGRRFVVFDNVPEGGTIDLAELAGMLTSRVWGDRELGLTQELEFPNQTVWAISANNPTFSTELARRVVRIRLDPRCERPQERDPKRFTHPDVLSFALEHRVELVAAGLTILNGWLAAGRPYSGSRIGSFERWCEAVGGALEVAGVPGFLGNRDKLYALGDREGSEWRAFVRSWLTIHGESTVHTAALETLCCRQDLLGSVLASCTQNQRARRTALGIALTSKAGRIYQGVRIESARDTKTNRAAWRLVPETEMNTPHRDLYQLGPGRGPGVLTAPHGDTGTSGTSGTSYLPPHDDAGAQRASSSGNKVREGPGGPRGPVDPVKPGSKAGTLQPRSSHRSRCGGNASPEPSEGLI